MLMVRCVKLIVQSVRDNIKVDILKAVVYRGPHNIKVEDVSEPLVTGKKVLVDFKSGGLCGTDMHFYRGDWRWMKRGRIIGHDASGIRVDSGERVVMIPLVYCGKCYYCLRGLSTYCTRGKFLGLRDGFFAEKIALNPSNLIPIPTTLAMMKPHLCSQWLWHFAC